MELRVLIVDDSSVMRHMVLRSLRQAGIEVKEVHEAATGAEALERFDPRAIDLIVSDLHMPEMDGYEFVRRVRALGAQVPILLVTAEAGMGKLSGALADGANAYLHKPPQAGEIQARLAEIFHPDSAGPSSPSGD